MNRMRWLPYIVYCACAVVSFVMWRHVCAIGRVRSCLVANGLHHDDGLLGVVSNHHAGLFLFTTVLSHSAFWGWRPVRIRLGGRRRWLPDAETPIELTAMALYSVAWSLAWVAMVSEMIVAQHGAH